MSSVRRNAVGGAAAVLSAVVLAAAAGAAHWRRETGRVVATLLAGASEPRASGATAFVSHQLAGLPRPVARYFERVLARGHPLIRSARIEHVGEFRASLPAPWVPFHSVQHITTEPPGFVWDARIEVVPLLGVRVRDSYIHGAARMLGKAAALVPIVDEVATPELNSGALHRYLAEAVWIPTALLPTRSLVWEAIDDSSARVSLTDRGTTVSLEVLFSPDAEIVQVSGQRFRDVDGVALPTPWVGRFWNYGTADGIRIPMDGEVEWILPEGRLTYWRGRIHSAEFQFGR